MYNLYKLKKYILLSFSTQGTYWNRTILTHK